MNAAQRTHAASRAKSAGFTVRYAGKTDSIPALVWEPMAIEGGLPPWDPPRHSMADELFHATINRAPDKGFIVVVEYDGEIVASLTAILGQELLPEPRSTDGRVPKHHRRVLWIENVYCERKFRKKGAIGGAMSFAVQQAIAKTNGRLEVIRLTTNRVTRPESIGMYAHWGMKESVCHLLDETEIMKERPAPASHLNGVPVKFVVAKPKHKTAVQRLFESHVDTAVSQWDSGISKFVDFLLDGGDLWGRGGQLRLLLTSEGGDEVDEKNAIALAAVQCSLLRPGFDPMKPKGIVDAFKARKDFEFRGVTLQKDEVGALALDYMFSDVWRKHGAGVVILNAYPSKETLKILGGHGFQPTGTAYTAYINAEEPAGEAA